MTGTTLVSVGDGGSDAGGTIWVSDTVSDAGTSGEKDDRDALERYQQPFHGNFATMTRLAAILGADDPEDVAQEAFVRLHRRRLKLRDPHASIGYVRTTVVNLSRSRVRHLSVVRRNRPAPPSDAESAEHQGGTSRGLPRAGGGHRSALDPAP